MNRNALLAFVRRRGLIHSSCVRRLGTSAGDPSPPLIDLDEVAEVRRRWLSHLCPDEWLRERVARRRILSRALRRVRS